MLDHLLNLITLFMCVSVVGMACFSFSRFQKAEAGEQRVMYLCTAFFQMLLGIAVFLLNILVELM